MKGAEKAVILILPLALFASALFLYNAHPLYTFDATVAPSPDPTRPPNSTVDAGPPPPNSTALPSNASSSNPPPQSNSTINPPPPGPPENQTLPPQNDTLPPNNATLPGNAGDDRYFSFSGWINDWMGLTDAGTGNIWMDVHAVNWDRNARDQKPYAIFTIKETYYNTYCSPDNDFGGGGCAEWTVKDAPPVEVSWDYVLHPETNVTNLNKYEMIVTVVAIPDDRNVYDQLTSGNKHYSFAAIGPMFPNGSSIYDTYEDGVPKYVVLSSFINVFDMQTGGHYSGSVSPIWRMNCYKGMDSGLLPHYDVMDDP